MAAVESVIKLGVAAGQFESVTHLSQLDTRGKSRSRATKYCRAAPTEPRARLFGIAPQAGSIGSMTSTKRST